MDEERINFEVNKLFYNPNMRFCRTFGSLSIAAISEKITVLDGFAASGIRGLRYAKENKNVKKIVFLDVWKIAPNTILKNAEKNKIKKFEIFNSDFNEFVIKNAFDFIEIDPFGSPVPFLNNAFYSFRKKKSGYISITATDVAVLCGENTRACLKKYGAKNLRNEFTHEIGVRILLKKIADFASQFDFGIEPLYSISNRHYIKILIKITSSAKKASEIPQNLGYLSYCFHCGEREIGKFPNRICANCKKDMDYAGQLWLSKLHNKKFLKAMKKTNAGRNYADKKEIDGVLDLLIEEENISPFYYNIHDFCRREKYPNIPKRDKIISELKKKGFTTGRTHFDNRCIKTNAKIKDIKKLFQTIL